MSGATTEVRDIDDLIEDLLAKADAECLSALFDSMPLSDALRELLQLSPTERDAVLSLLPSEKSRKTDRRST
ncbi:hypothetical protein [Allomesorhizobium alhagi]|uniref:Magnesium transporter MgtE intracellular domain-containing protein n=1 Tax=Mesorhizobium alhagi CCNWXJ12-2 TaxID=1107882 RepID=H0I2Z0_9HYPH|nr:hypothetical protein [Mesorhizobium alhagi]EHK52628.1 hypothetical protein MAXJ12_34239 [Mesorhizobium alhagi CCNWXJ12-2]